ncbi:LysR family transcriptional regulator [Carnobacterium sp. TMP28]|uniref:LysR family transcriptional regulator n=1 Tax=Carnobacterium sp. TMP28 TaxID=3397060 RepID=UPI0039DF4B3F
MLDYRYQTFLTLAEVMNYTQTAKKLHITQPAVTQHIQYLQNELNVELLHYENRQVTLTKKGKQLQKDLLLLQKEIQQIQKKLAPKMEAPSFIFGATLTIGEYTMPDSIEKYIHAYPTHTLSMLVDNTASLIDHLEHGTIDFAFVEGEFNQQVFGFHKLSDESFIAVCAESNPLWKKKQPISDLFSHQLIIREIGSGSRLILETALKNKSILLESFTKMMMIGNISTIKELVKKDLGITFLYRSAVEEELAAGTLKEIKIKDFVIEHPFHLIYLKTANAKGMEIAQQFIKLLT